MLTVTGFHNNMLARQKFFPLSLNATDTHNTRRGEELRLRIIVLSKWQQHWKQLVSEWQQLDEHFAVQLDTGRAPVLNDEYFCYPSLLGNFPEYLK